MALELSLDDIRRAWKADKVFKPKMSEGDRAQHLGKGRDAVTGAEKPLSQDTKQGAAFTITQPIIDTTTENATGSSADLAIFITGRDLDVLRDIAVNILELTRSTDGASESSIEQENKQSQVVIRIDKQAAARYGINVEDVNGILKTAIAGLPVSHLYEDERKFDIVLRFTVESRNTPQSLEKILIPSRTGQRIPLNRVASVGLEEGQTIICREDGRRQMTVKTNIRERDRPG